MLHLYRRHTKLCPHSSQRYRRCQCPIYVKGTLRAEYIKKSLDLTSWDAAQSLIAAWTDAGEIGVVKAETPTVSEAVSSFFEDAKARHLGWETMRKYRNLLDTRFLSWCETKGIRLLKQIDVAQLRAFRATWEDGPLYAMKNLERMRAFFRFCHQSGWMKANPATAVKAPEVKPNPTLPFSDEDFKKILDACDRYRGNKRRIRAFILVMRFSGLRIGDTIRLKRDQVLDGRIRLYTAKTGQAVWVPIPKVVVDALAKVVSGESYFWSGRNIRSAVSNWSRYLGSVFETAQVDDAHSHRFRDTAATSWLMAGLSVEEVATLLGNTPAIVVKHYSPWIRERQERLDSKVQASWGAA